MVMQSSSCSPPPPPLPATPPIFPLPIFLSLSQVGQVQAAHSRAACLTTPVCVSISQTRAPSCAGQTLVFLRTRADAESGPGRRAESAGVRRGLGGGELGIVLSIWGWVGGGVASYLARARPSALGRPHGKSNPHPPPSPPHWVEGLGRPVPGTCSFQSVRVGRHVVPGRCGRATG